MQSNNDMWIMTLQIANIFGIIMVFFTYLYVFLTSKNKYIGLCSIGWGLYIVLGVVVTTDVISNYAVQSIFFMTANLLISKGIYGSINTKMTKGVLWLAAAVQIYTIIGYILGLHVSIYLIPNFIFQTYLFVVTGYNILKSNILHGLSKHLYGWIFILLGMHLFNYPLLQIYKNLMALGFFVSTLLVLILVMASFIHFFHMSKNELDISESTFKSAFEQTGLGMVLVSIEGVFLKVNKEFCNMLGYEESELLGKKFLDITISENWKADKEEVRKKNREIRQLVIEKRYRHKQGHEIWVKVISTLIKDENQIPIHYIAQVENISEHKKWKDNVIESRNFYANLFNELPTMIWRSDKDGMCSYANKVWLNFVGRTEEQEYGLGWKENIHPEDLKNCMTVLENALLDKTGFQLMYRVKRADGQWRWVKNISTPNFDKEESFQGFIGTCYDITENWEVVERITESEKKYRHLIETLPLGILVHDRGKILFVNKVGAEIFGASDEFKVLGKTTYEFIHPDYHMEHKNKIEELLSEIQKNVSISRKKIVKMDSTIIDVESMAIYFPYMGRPCILHIFRDITQENQVQELKIKIDENTKRLQEAIEYDKLKTEFFANLSHEFRTPINIIFSTIQLLELYAKNGKIASNEEKLKKYIGSVKQNCYRLLRMANNIIDASKIDSGYLELNLKNYNIVEVVENTVLSVVEYAKQKNIEIEFDTEIEERIIACDVDKIERVILNLLSNALKFTGNGGKAVVSIVEQDTFIVIQVKDNGIGIPQDKVEMIFERFMQVDKTLARSCEGSGIGLSIVKSLVEMHNGKIRVTSKFGEGTEFVIELPIITVDGEVQKVSSIATLGPESKDTVNIEFSDIA